MIDNNNKKSSESWLKGKEKRESCCAKEKIMVMVICRNKWIQHFFWTDTDEPKGDVEGWLLHFHCCYQPQGASRFLFDFRCLRVYMRRYRKRRKEGKRWLDRTWNVKWENCRRTAKKADLIKPKRECVPKKEWKENFLLLLLLLR